MSELNESTEYKVPTFVRWVLFISMFLIGSVTITTITMPIAGYWLMVPASIAYGLFGVKHISNFCFGRDVIADIFER